MTGSFLEVNELGRGINHPPPSRTKDEERVGQYLYSLSAFRELQGELYLLITQSTLGTVCIGGGHRTIKKSFVKWNINKPCTR